MKSRRGVISELHVYWTGRSITPEFISRARRSTATETNSAIDRSVRALRDITNIV